MHATQLEPLSATIRFMSVSPRSSCVWGRIIGRLLQGIADRCETAGREVVIGHIKGFALLEKREHLRISVISGAYPAEIDSSADVEMNELQVSVNVIVYGIAAGSLERIVRDKVSSLNGQSGIEAAIESVSATHHFHEGRRRTDTSDLSTRRE